MKFIQRHTVLAYPEYYFQIDEYRDGDGQQALLAHLRFDEFSKEILKRVLREWKVFREVVHAPLFAYGEDQDEKWEHFVALLGFKPTEQYVVCNNGARRRLFISIAAKAAPSIKELPHERRQQTNPAIQPDPERGIEPVGPHAGAAAADASGRP